MSARLDDVIKVLETFAKHVYNDNGDMTVGIETNREPYVRAYYLHKELTRDPR